MRLTSLTTRRLGAIAGAAFAAIAIPAAALAASVGPGTAAKTAAPAAAKTAAPAAAHRCYAADLTAWLGLPSNNGAGSSYFQLEISNISGHSCTLYGFPGVSLQGPHGQIGAAAQRNGGRPRLVTISSHSTAHAILTFRDVAVVPSCKPKKAVSVKVYAPGDTKAIGFSLDGLSFTSCTKRSVKVISVSYLKGKAGIPLFSR